MKKIVVVLMAVLSLACAGCGDSGSTATTPAAPVVSMNDTTNLITLGAGVDGSTLEVAVDGGAYAAFNAATTYDGNHTVKVRVKAAGGNLAGTDTVFTFTATPDAATTVTAPVLSSKTTSTINVTPGTFSDTDGVQQVVVALYNATRTTRLATAANGQFSGLAAATAYSLRMEGQAKNGTSGLFEDKTSGWTDVVTEIPAAPPAPAVTFNDIANTIVLNSADPATLEISLNSGTSYAPYAAATYPNDAQIYVRVKANGATPASAPTILTATEVAFDTITQPAAVAVGETKTFTFKVKNLSTNFSNTSTITDIFTPTTIQNNGAVSLLDFRIIDFNAGIFAMYYKGKTTNTTDIRRLTTGNSSIDIMFRCQ
jgi:hypothetical protein